MLLASTTMHAGHFLSTLHLQLDGHDESTSPCTCPNGSMQYSLTDGVDYTNNYFFRQAKINAPFCQGFSHV